MNPPTNIKVLELAVECLISKNLRLVHGIDREEVSAGLHREIARICAHEFLRGAGLVFDRHAEMARMLEHIRTLEYTLDVKGVLYTPYGMRLVKEPTP